MVVGWCFRVRKADSKPIACSFSTAVCPLRLRALIVTQPLGFVAAAASLAI